MDQAAEDSSSTQITGRPPRQAAAWGDELRNALAFAFFAAVYARMLAGLFALAPPAPAGALLRGFAAGYGLAALVFALAHGLAGIVLRLAPQERRTALHPLAAPLASLVAAALALPRLF